MNYNVLRRHAFVDFVTFRLAASYSGSGFLDFFVSIQELRQIHRERRRSQSIPVFKRHACENQTNLSRIHIG